MAVAIVKMCLEAKYTGFFHGCMGFVLGRKLGLRVVKYPLLWGSLHGSEVAPANVAVNGHNADPRETL
jgi:hypothetical protein